MIKFIDLVAQNGEVMADLEPVLEAIHARASYIDGPQVESFEKAFAKFVGARKAIGVASGTDALRLTLMAAGIGAGDEVITTPSTFIATAEAVVQAGATPTLVEIDPKTGNMSPDALENYLSRHQWRSNNGPRAILPVHLYGQPADMSRFRELADRYQLMVLEDACQAHGARVRLGDEWKSAGSIGTAGCFSFYPAKNLGAWGDAGAVVTDDEELAARVLKLRNHGRLSHYAHEDCGYTARLDTIQAAVLEAKLRRLPQWNARRREIADLYAEALLESGVEVPEEPEGIESCYHLYVIRAANRDAIRAELLTRKIECGIHYPVPLHLQPALRMLGYRKGDFPESERMADSVLSLPMHPHMKDEEVAQVADAVTHACKQTHGLFAGGRATLQAASPPRAAE